MTFVIETHYKKFHIPPLYAFAKAYSETSTVKDIILRFIYLPLQQITLYVS
ncbi:hypothetical protein [Dokdonia sp.]|uniref:hypothetical protein n=1 Tax=Dokdonia sp. TaxID=2024995 RepID=UPI0032673B51